MRSPQHTGVDAGRFFPFGNAADLPPDQREEDGRSVCFDRGAGGAVGLLGRPRVRLRLTLEVPRGQVDRPAVRRGAGRLLDTGHPGRAEPVRAARAGPGRAVAAGATEDVEFELNGIGHVFPVGHRIRLAVSSAYWPWIWPQPDTAAGFTLDPAGSSLELPVRGRR